MRKSEKDTIAITWNRAELMTSLFCQAQVQTAKIENCVYLLDALSLKRSLKRK